MRRTNRAFSLIEVLIVAGLIGVISTLAAPGIVRTLDTYGLDSDISMLRAKLTEARMNAIKRNRQAWLAIDASEGTVRVQSTTGNPATTVSVGTQGYLGSRAAFSGANPTQVTFDSMGRTMAAETLTVRATRTGLQRTVIVSAAGKVTVN
jgi:prepilin-type N-terminal cleavage/methylation domain-containing protein